MLKSDEFMGKTHVHLDALRQREYEFFEEQLSGVR